MLSLYLAMLETAQEKQDFSLMYNEYGNLMYFVADQVLHDNYLAEDAVHEAFVYIIRHFSTIRKDNKKELKSFVMLATRHKALDILKKRKRETPNESESFFESNMEKAPDAEDVTIQASSVEYLVEALSGMNEKYRYPLMLNAYGYKTKEIAELMDLSEDGVRTRLYRARRIARALLEEKTGEKTDI